MPEPDREFLTSRGWAMDEPADTCWLDCDEPGYRKVMNGREIILCLADALVLERGARDGDYEGALTPEDSLAAAWPFMETVS